MAKRKLHKKARVVKTVETYTVPGCSMSRCNELCDMTVADVRVQTQASIRISGIN